MYWHRTEGQKWTPSDQLMWLSTWALSVAASSLAGTKKGDSIFKNMPKYPWSEKDEGLSRLGSLKGVKQEDVLDYLDSL